MKETDTATAVPPAEPEMPSHAGDDSMVLSSDEVDELYRLMHMRDMQGGRHFSHTGRAMQASTSDKRMR